MLAGCVAAALAFAATSACAQAREVHAATCGGDVRAHWHGGPSFEYRRAVGAAPAKTDVYARETDTFLASRDGRVQAAQIAAIRRATAGETADLKAVLALDYALAPEHPFPAALNDVCASFRAVVSNPARFGADLARVSIGGDSSGGNLALAAVLVLQKENLKPLSLVLYYPVTEAQADGSASWRMFATGCGMDAAFMDACCVAYLNGHDPRDPLVSPAFVTDAHLRRLSPVHILGADRDVLRDQGVRFARRLESPGSPVRAEVLPGSTHLFVTVKGQPAAFARAVAFATEAMKWHHTGSLCG